MTGTGMSIERQQERNLKILIFFILLCGVIMECAQSATSEKEKQQNVVKAIGNGHMKKELEDMLKEMQRNIPKGTETTQQHMLVAPLYIDEASIYIREVKFYKNYYWSDFREVCDDQCKRGIESVTTKRCHEDTLTPDTKIHTELQFMYGDESRMMLGKGGIFLIYSHFIPCAQLFNCSFGECSGDLGHYLTKNIDNSAKQTFFITLYKQNFQIGCTKTNICVSQLYQALAGIPVILCTEGECKPDNHPRISFEDYVSKPTKQNLPRIHSQGEAKELKTDVFLLCLARGEYVQELTETYFTQARSSADEAIREAVVLQLLEAKIGRNRFDYNNLVNEAFVLARGDNLEKCHEIIKRCEEYVSCLLNLRTRKQQIGSKRKRYEDLCSRTRTRTFDSNHPDKKIFTEMCDRLQYGEMEKPDVCIPNDMRNNEE